MRGPSTPPDRRRRWSGSPQADLFGREPASSARFSAPSAAPQARPFPQASAEEVERVRIGTLLMLFQLMDGDGDTAYVAGLHLADALAAWHSSRPSQPSEAGSADDPPF